MRRPGVNSLVLGMASGWLANGFGLVGLPGLAEVFELACAPTLVFGLAQMLALARGSDKGEMRTHQGLGG